MKVVSASLRKIDAFLRRTPEQAAAIEAKRVKRDEGTKNERFYEQKALLAEDPELLTEEEPTSLRE